MTSRPHFTARHAEQWVLLVEQRDQLPNAVNEVLRWTSSATHSMRTATNAVELGAGPHACVGAALARVQSTVLLAELLDLGGWFEPTENTRPVRSIVVGGPAHLPVRFTAFPPPPSARTGRGRGTAPQ
ncbi:hypothetical protein ACFVVX_34640 [Kitasatospora sp. NPDC058170]|uniref:hypothetical protein n=1 Tax=Kitasatospora sp. NPDC058170 TaxID=3346364 RepID=UPI0036DB6BA6